MNAPFKYIFGPVHSWRLGMSLGIDPVSSKDKICNMDCVYCQLGRSPDLVTQRKVYVPTQDIVREIGRVSLGGVDHITFAGRGEPTLAENLGEMIRQVKSLRGVPVAVLTNSLLMHLPKVRADLMEADVVVAKLDAGDQSVFEAVGHAGGSDLENMIQGIIDFRRSYKGKLALQIMLVEQNILNAGRIAQAVRRIGADEIQLDTPLRPGAAKPLDRQRMEWAKEFFKGLPVISVFDAPPKEYTPMDEKATALRHGNYRKKAEMFRKKV